MVYTTKSLQGKPVGVYRCSRYVYSGRDGCSPHYLYECDLEQYILNDLHHHALLAIEDQESITRQIVSMLTKRETCTREAIVKEQVEAETRLQTIAAALKSLYLDKCSGELPSEVFHSLMEGFTKEQGEFQESLKQLSNTLHEQARQTSKVGEWIKAISKQFQLTQIDRETLLELVESIDVAETTQPGGPRKFHISIHYKFVGNLDLIKNLPQNAKEGTA